jgi:CDP-glycerol glycerophosphotransferase
MHLFRYVRDKHPEVDSYYVIEKGSPDKRNLEGYDNVIDFRSKEHVNIALRADALISTHSSHFILPTVDAKFRKKLNAKTVFLQHGVTAQKWMTPVYGKRNFSGFRADQIMATSQREKEIIVQDWGFHPKQVAVAGFPRFDALFAGDIEINKKQLLIMPTWRPWLLDYEQFQESDYYQKWMSLLTGRELNELRDKYDLELVFCLHPNMRQYASIFKGLGARVVTQGETEIQHLIKESAALCTDLSSVAMDFSFLHKPVVYYQFDAHRFHSPHADPQTELPGPVVSDAQAAAQALDQAFGNQGRMTAEYQERADRFIDYRDTSNCERVFEAVKQPVYKAPMRYRLLENERLSKFYALWRKHPSYFPVIQKMYLLMRMLPIDKKTIVFESNLARSFGDSPRAIYNELVRRGDTRNKVIVCNKPVRHFDEKTRVVKRHSLAFVYYMARSKYWVNNHNFPFYLRRRKKGVFVQTWHGTPLKRMMFDQDNFYGRDSGYIERVKQAVAQWGMLVSPNPHTTKVMRSAYRFIGPVVELGYPRNDILLSSSANHTATRVRSSLGISSDKTVVLYAPTFRDDKPTKSGRFAFEWPFDAYRWAEQVGSSVVLLVRTHNLVSNKPLIPKDLAHKIIDVTNYPEIQELFLASDVLVTDYSSSFFDYAILQRPILFYAYDLENYRDNLRGFYLDYDFDLPGPIVTDEQTLFTKVRECADPATRPISSVTPGFLAKYAPHDDGRASERVIEQLLGGVR